MNSKVNIFGYDFVKIGSAWIRKGSKRNKFDIADSIRKLVKSSSYHPDSITRYLPPIVENYRDINIKLLINLLNNLVEVFSAGFIPTSDYILSNNGFVHKDVYSPTDLSRSLRRVEYYDANGRCKYTAVSTIGVAIENISHWMNVGGYVIVY